MTSHDNLEPDWAVAQGDLSPNPAPTLSVDSLSNAQSVTFHMKPRSGSGTTIDDSTHTQIIDTANAKVAYDFQSGDTDVPGYYLLRWEVTWQNGDPESFPNDGHDLLYIDPD